MALVAAGGGGGIGGGGLGGAGGDGGEDLAENNKWDGYYDRQDEEEVILKSKTSTKHAYIRFVNMTQRRVDVIWINYEGVRVKYKTLDPNEFFDVTSFVNHPWIFRDAETHNKLVVSQQEVFDVPEPVYLKLQNGKVQPTRAIVGIQLPLYSLRECALQAVQRCLRTPDDVYRLEIPISLKRELYARCNFKGSVNLLGNEPRKPRYASPAVPPVPPAGPAQ